MHPTLGHWSAVPCRCAWAPGGSTSTSARTRRWSSTGERTRWYAVGAIIGLAVAAIVLAGACVLLIAAFTAGYS